METDIPTRIHKRARSDSFSSTSSLASNSSHSSSHSSSRPASPLNKIQRASAKPSTETLECTLPPTCFPTSRTFDSISELERHQLAFHTYICRTPIKDRTDTGTTGQTGQAEAGPSKWTVPREFTSKKGAYTWKECRKVFPDQRLLDLHQAETHDPIQRQKLKDGLPIFKCFIPPPECTRVFINPKHRRLHLIDKHKYPREYYFSITNHGLNRITEAEGLGASLIRPRTYYSNTNEKRAAQEPATATEGVVDVDMDMDSLTRSMGTLESSLSLVPNQVRRKDKGKGKAVTRKVLEGGIC